MSTTVETARGRWPGILEHFGIDESYLRNRHGPCPLCGGRDRFRFDDKDGRGTYYCNQCGPGDGITLLRRFKDWDFRTAAAQIDAVIGRIPESSRSNTDAAGRLEMLQRLLKWSLASHLVGKYLTSRGLSVTSPILRGHSGLWHTESGRRVPAVVAPVVEPTGGLQSVMRIFVEQVEPRKKLMPPVTTIRGCSVHLYESAPVMAVAEGIETALAVREMFGLPIWAALSANGLATFQPPAVCQVIRIFSDNDANGTGQSAAHSLAARLVRAGIAAEVVSPPLSNTDWLDVLNRKEDA